MQQVSMFGGVNDQETAGRKKRFTHKHKKAALQAILAQIRGGWEAPEEVWRLVDWLSAEVARSAKEK